MGEPRNAYKTTAENCNGREYIGDSVVGRRIILKWVSEE
jgi:hypothetical protein